MIRGVSYMRIKLNKSRVVLCFIILSFILPKCLSAQNTFADVLKGRINTIKVIETKEFSLSNKSEDYLIAMLDDPLADHLRLKIYKEFGTEGLLEIYDNPIGGKLIILELKDITGDSIPEIIIISSCGQRGLSCIKVIKWNTKNDKFSEELADQAQYIKLCYKNKISEIYMSDNNDITCDKMEGKDYWIYFWSNGKFKTKEFGVKAD